MNRVFIDMDGVIVDFDGYIKKNNLTIEQAKNLNGAYLEMEPIPGALEAARKIISLGFDVFIATRPVSGRSNTYSEKAEWVIKYLPELTNKIIMTHDKGLLGDEKDFLIDDSPHKANCMMFKGTLIEFNKMKGWQSVLFSLKGE